MVHPVTLTGSLELTNNFELVSSLLADPQSNVMIIKMDEDDMRLDINHPKVIGGTCLLPPMQAMIAAADGDKMTYQSIYADHFNDPFVDNYISALIIFLSKGGHLIIHYEDQIGIVPDLLRFFWMRYGINIGVIGESPFSLDPTCSPIWLQYLYRENRINGEDFLYNYPLNTVIPEAVADKLLMELSPYGETAEDRLKALYDLSAKLKINVNTVDPLIWTG